MFIECICQCSLGYRDDFDNITVCHLIVGINRVSTAIVLGGRREVVHPIDITVDSHEVGRARVSQGWLVVGVAIDKTLFKDVIARDRATSESHSGTACITGVSLDGHASALRASGGEDASFRCVHGVSQS